MEDPARGVITGVRWYRLYLFAGLTLFGAAFLADEGPGIAGIAALAVGVAGLVHTGVQLRRGHRPPRPGARTRRTDPAVGEIPD